MNSFSTFVYILSNFIYVILLWRVKVYVEDKDSSGVCVVLKLKPSMTIQQLKSKVRIIKIVLSVQINKWTDENKSVLHNGT